MMKTAHAIRLGALVSHPIPYQAPLFRALAAHPEVDLTVLFCTDWGFAEYRDEGFGQKVQWDVPLVEGYRWQVLPNVSPRRNPSGFWGLINLAAISHLKRGTYDALWIHGWASCTNWLAMVTAFQQRIPVLLRGESTLLTEPSGLKWHVKRLILRYLFQRVTSFLTIGQYNADFYRAYGVPDYKHYLVPYSVDNAFFCARADELTPQKDKLKHQLGIPQELPVILFTGKLVEHKGTLDLLEAYIKLSKPTKAALVFVGDGRLRSVLESRARENHLQHVYFMGFQNQSAIPRFYAIADIFVLPSRFEPWGLVLNEAMCFGLPVVVSDQVGASGDLVKEGRNGFIFASGHVEGLAHHLDRLIGAPELRRAMGSQSRQIIANWSFTECVQGLLACLKTISSSHT